MSEDNATIARLRLELVELAVDRDHWKRYANGLEARLEKLTGEPSRTPDWTWTDGGAPADRA